MRAFLLTLAACAVCALAVACGSPASENTTTNTKTTTTNSANGSTTTTTTTTTTTASPAASPATSTASTGDKIGVPECDDYIAKVEACLKGKVPEASKGALQTALDTNRKAWRDAAANPQTKAALAQGCKTATETARTAWKAYGCDF